MTGLRISTAAARGPDRLAPLPAETSPKPTRDDLRKERSELLALRQRRGLTPVERGRLRDVEARLDALLLGWAA